MNRQRSEAQISVISEQMNGFVLTYHTQPARGWSIKPLVQGLGSCVAELEQKLHRSREKLIPLRKEAVCHL